MFRICSINAYKCYAVPVASLHFGTSELVLVRKRLNTCDWSCPDNYLKTSVSMTGLTKLLLVAHVFASGRAARSLFGVTIPNMTLGAIADKDAEGKLSSIT